MKLSKPHLELHFIILLNSLIPSVVRLINLPSVEIVFFRTLTASVLLWGILRIKKRKKVTDTQTILKLLSLGLLVSLYWILSILSAKISTASICLVGMATTSLWVAFLEPFLTGKKRQPFQVVIGLNAILGIYIIFNSGFEYGWGLTVAIISAFFGALLTILSAKFAKKYHQQTITFYQMGGAWIGTSLFLPFYINFFSKSGAFQWSMSLEDLVLIIALALTFSVWAYSVFIKIMKKIAPFTVALVSNLAPVYGMIAAVAFFKAPPMSKGFYIGTLLLLLSVFAYPLQKFYRQHFVKKQRLKVKDTGKNKRPPQSRKRRSPRKLSKKASN